MKHKVHILIIILHEQDYYLAKKSDIQTENYKYHSKPNFLTEKKVPFIKQNLKLTELENQ